MSFFDVGDRVDTKFVSTSDAGQIATRPLASTRARKKPSGSVNGEQGPTADSAGSTPTLLTRLTHHRSQHVACVIVVVEGHQRYCGPNEAGIKTRPALPRSRRGARSGLFSGHPG